MVEETLALLHLWIIPHLINRIRLDVLEEALALLDLRIICV
jgi:hypothetical protein